MRTARRLVFSSLLLAATVSACGGSHKPAESADTSSLESSGSAAKDAPASDTAPAGGATTASASASAPAASASAGASEAASAPSEPVHPTPSVTGAIDGKPFSPKLAHVVGKLQKDKRILVSIDERTDCPAADAKADDATLTILVPWEDGYKIDLSALKRATKKSANEIGFSRTNAAGKKEYVASFKPSGRLTVVKAPTDKDATGKLNIDLQSGDYMLAGDLDVQMCVAPK